ncbi:MAG: DUF1186 domain-containing protein [Betaproteobacteria bacterium]
MSELPESFSRWDRIASELDYIDLGFPTEAVIEARDHWAELRQAFLNELTRAVVNPARAIDEGNALPLYAIYLAAEMRDNAFEPAMLDLLRLPIEQIDGLIGDTLTEGMGRCLASVHVGDGASLRVLATAAGADIYARLAAVDALRVRTMEGDADPGETAAFLFDLAQELAIALHAKPPPRDTPYDRIEDDEFFNALVCALADLGATQYWGAIEQWHRDGLIDPYVDDIDNIRETLFAGREVRLARMHKPRYIRDAVAEMSWWACFNEDDYEGDLNTADCADLNRYGESMAEPFVRTQPKVGRNDPCPCRSGKKFKKCCGADL